MNLCGFKNHSLLDLDEIKFEVYKNIWYIVKKFI